MSRGSTEIQQGSGRVSVTVKVPRAMAERLQTLVNGRPAQDLDKSKFIRQAIEEKLARMSALPA